MSLPPSISAHEGPSANEPLDDANRQRIGGEMSCAFPPYFVMKQKLVTF
jgi:hypothetical protein